MKQKSIKAMEKELAALEPQSTAHQAQQLGLPPHVQPEDPAELQELCNLALHPITADERKDFRPWDDELEFEKRVVTVRRGMFFIEQLTKKCEENIKRREAGLDGGTQA